MKKHILLTAALLSVCVLSANGYEINVRDQSLCTQKEEVVAACVLKGKPSKMLSICSSPTMAKDNHIVYRYGSKKKIEMSYVVDSNSTNNQIYRGTYFGGSNQTTVYWFKKSEYLYKIAIPGTGLVHLSVLKNNRSIFSRDCTSNSIGNVEAKNSLFIEKSSDETFDVWTSGD